MSYPKTTAHSRSYLKQLLAWLERRRLRRNPNLRGTTYFPPGHFSSPLLDITSLRPDDREFPFDGAEHWRHIDLRPREQRAYYEELLSHPKQLAFPEVKTDPYRYFTHNGLFPFSDAFTLSGVIRRENPHRIIEVGSGFSSAAVLDTLEHTSLAPQLTFIEPYPDRLYSLLSSRDKARSKVLVEKVQEVPLEVFDQLGPGDLLFIDSSHIVKVGSDVTHIFLRVLPRLKTGVLVHFHDIFFPFSYPMEWIREGRAWNESLMLRAFLIGTAQFQIVAFNSYAGRMFSELFVERMPAFLENPGGSLWLRKVGAPAASSGVN